MWQWYAEYQNFRNSRPCPELIENDKISVEKELEALGLFFTGLVILHRLIFALDPSSNHEKLAQKHARLVIGLNQKTQSFAAQSWLFTVLKVNVAKATQFTAEDWGMERDGLAANSLPEPTFLRWCHLLGWKVECTT